jgi:hypothetical protein
MKQSQLKWSGLVLISGIVLTSCMPEVETPNTMELAKTAKESTQVVTGEENFRKSPNGVFYQEKFTNQSILAEDPSAFPGFGVGNATYIGKGLSFFNQKTLGSPDEYGVVFTKAAPVTDYFKEELEALGINTDELDEFNESGDDSKIVSSLTTDGKGNTIWFNNVETRAQFDHAGNITFEADITILGGTGKFKGASGFGTVVGNVGEFGKGTSTLRANIVF